MTVHVIDWLMLLYILKWTGHGTAPEWVFLGGWILAVLEVMPQVISNIIGVFDGRD